MRSQYTCYCGSKECPPAQCRFYRDEEEAKQQQEEFWAQWHEAERRSLEEAHAEVGND